MSTTHASLSGADFNRILAYPLKDNDWFVKLCLQGAVLFLLAFTIIGAPLFIGFLLAFVRKGINGEDTLPDWSEWAQYWKDGWRLFAVNLAYLSPVLFVWMVVAFSYIISIALIAVDDEFAPLLFICVLLSIGGYALTIVFSVVMWFIGPAVQPLVALGVPIKQCLNLKGYIWPYIKVNIIGIILSVIITYLAGLIASLGMFMLFIGLFLTYPYAIAVAGYSIGSVYRLSPIKHGSTTITS